MIHSAFSTAPQPADNAHMAIIWPMFPILAMMPVAAAMMPVMRMALGALAGLPWVSMGMHMPIGPCGQISFTARREGGA